jgi:hypothetical protein
VVGVLGLLWNSYGGFDFTMSLTRGDAYYREVDMSDAQIAHMATYPAWMIFVWAIGVWGALLGAVLVLARSKWAVEVFAASLAGFLMSLVYAYLISPMPDSGSAMAIMQGVILAGCVFFVWYAVRARKAGHLR